MTTPSSSDSPDSAPATPSTTTKTAPANAQSLSKNGYNINAPSSVTSALNRHLDFIANDLSSALSSRQGDKDNADDDNDSDDAPVKKSASSTTSKLNRLLSRKLDSDSDSDLKENDSAFKAAAPAAEVLDYSVSVSPTMKPNNVAPQHKDNQISVAKKRKNTDSKMGDAFKKTSRPMMAKERVAEIVEDDEDAGGRRKSRRVSVQPVEWWKGERVEYKMVLDKQTGVTVPQLDAQTLPKPIVSRRESMGKSVPRQHVVDDDSDSSNDEEKEEKEENSYKQENHPSTTSRRKSSSSTTTKNQSKSIKSRRASTASTSTTVSSKRPSKKKLSTNNLSDSSDNDADGNSYNNSNNNIVTINSHIQPPKSGPFTISAIDVATDTPTEQSLVYGPLDISPQPFGSFSLHRTFTIGDYCGVGFMDVPVGGEKGEKNAGSTSVLFYVISGRVKVVLNHVEICVGKGAHFLVPRGNLYNVVNMGKKVARIYFVQVRGPVAEDRVVGEGGKGSEESSRVNSDDEGGEEEETEEGGVNVKVEKGEGEGNDVEVFVEEEELTRMDDKEREEEDDDNH